MVEIASFKKVASEPLGRIQQACRRSTLVQVSRGGMFVRRAYEERLDVILRLQESERELQQHADHMSSDSPCRLGEPGFRTRYYQLKLHITLPAEAPAEGSECKEVTELATAYGTLTLTLSPPSPSRTPNHHINLLVLWCGA